MLYIILYTIEVFGLAYIEKRLWRTYLTPLNFLSIPCYVVTMLAIVYSYYSQLVPDFYIPSLSVWMIGLLIFFLPSLIFSSVCANRDKRISVIENKASDYTVVESRIVYRIMLVVSLLCLSILFLRIRSLSLESFGSDEFSEQYSSGGIYGHLSVLVTTICAYMIYLADSKHKLAYVIIALSLVCMYARGTKSWIIAPVLIGLITRVLNGKTRLNYKLVTYILITCIGIYLFSYILILVIAGASEMNENFFTFLFEHFMFYLIGSPLSLSLDYQVGTLEPYMFDALFAPLINIIRLFTGDPYINPINPIAINLGFGEGNVRTFIGTIYVYSNSWMGMPIVLLLFSTGIYLLYVLTIHTKNLFFKLANASNLTFLSLGFFDFYWLILGTYEMLVIFILLGLITYYPISGKQCKAITNV